MQTPADNFQWLNTNNYPHWVEGFRPHQISAVQQIQEHWNNGVKVVMVDAPTGAGKTLIAEMARRLEGVGGAGLRSIYTCSTKTLQDQFLADFDYSCVMKGRANYPTELYPDRFHSAGQYQITAEDCEGDPCGLCVSRGTCPYQIAKEQAMVSDVAVLNMAYLLGEGNGRKSKFRGRDLVVVDEADLLERALMGYVEVRIGGYLQRKYGIGRPKKKTVPESWLEWTGEVGPKLQSALKKETRPKERGRLERLIGKVVRLRRDLMAGQDEDNTDVTRWVYTDYNSDSIVFKPVTVGKLAKDVLWPLGGRWLLMSASLISGEIMAKELGLEDGEWKVVEVASDFPAENRPVYVTPVGAMTRKGMEDGAVEKAAQAVKNILDMHPGENVLVHTVSYSLAKELQEKVGEGLTYTHAGEREAALDQFKKEGGVVFAPSFDRGVDLPGDLCTVQIIAKVPYPYLGDKQVEARLYSKGGDAWYAVQTVRSLVQMTGRGVRSKEDKAVTYVLDQSFLRLWRERKMLFPSWWREAVDVSGGKLADVRKERKERKEGDEGRSGRGSSQGGRVAGRSRGGSGGGGKRTGAGTAAGRWPEVGWETTWR